MTDNPAYDAFVRAGIQTEKTSENGMIFFISFLPAKISTAVRDDGSSAYDLNPIDLLKGGFGLVSSSQMKAGTVFLARQGNSEAIWSITMASKEEDSERLDGVKSMAICGRIISDNLLNHTCFAGALTALQEKEAIRVIMKIGEETVKAKEKYKSPQLYSSVLGVPITGLLTEEQATSVRDVLSELVRGSALALTLREVHERIGE